jgi:hypothetical protein
MADSDPIVRPADLEVSAGTRALKYVRLFRTFVSQRDKVIVSGDGGQARFKRSQDGLEIIVESTDRFKGRFRVSASSVEFRVSPGYVGDDMPSYDGVYLDGVNAETRINVGIPAIPIKESDIPEGGSTCVCVTIATVGGVPVKSSPEMKDPLTVEHIKDLRQARIDRPDTGFQKLGELYWSNRKTLLSVRQVVLHNLIHSYRVGRDMPDGSTGPGFHSFSGI